MHYQIWLLIAFLLLIHVLAGTIGVLLDKDIPLGIASIATGLVTFFWLIGWARKRSEPTDRDGMLRAAVAGAIVMQYLSMVGTATFFNVGSEDASNITQTLVSSFTAIVGIVIAFFFGASAYIEVKKGKTQTKSEGGSSDEETT